MTNEKSSKDSSLNSGYAGMDPRIQKILEEEHGVVFGGENFRSPFIDDEQKIGFFLEVLVRHTKIDVEKYKKTTLEVLSEHPLYSAQEAFLYTALIHRDNAWFSQENIKEHIFPMISISSTNDRLYKAVSSDLKKEFGIETKLD